MSGPAKQIVINLNAVIKATEGAKKAAEKSGHTMKEVFKAIGLEKLTEKALELGKNFAEAVFDANRFATQTKIAFEVMTGSASLASETFQEAKRVAFQLGVPVEQVAKSYKEMLSAGESVENLQAVAKAASDLSHFEGGSIESWTKAFSNILGRGQLTGRGTLEAFIGAVDFDALAKKLGFATHGFKALRDQLNLAPVSAFKGVQAILQTIAEGQGGKLETVSKRVADTFAGTLQSIKGEVMDLFEFDVTDSPVMEFLHGVRDALRPGSPLVVGIRAGAASFMEGLGILKGPGGFQDFIKSLKDGTILGSHFRETMREIGETARNVAEVLGMVARAVAAVGGAFRKVKEWSYAFERGRLGSGVEASPWAQQQLFEMEHGAGSLKKAGVTPLSVPALPETFTDAGLKAALRGGIVNETNFTDTGLDEVLRGGIVNAAQKFADGGRHWPDAGPHRRGRRAGDGGTGLEAGRHGGAHPPEPGAALPRPGRR